MRSDLRQRVRSPRAVSQTAPGRLRASYRPALRPVCEVLAALAPGRVPPFAPGNSRKRGPGLSQGVTVLASAAVERREASGLRSDRCRARIAIRWQHLIAWCGSKTLRLPALRLPSLFRGGFSFVAWHDSGAFASREWIAIASGTKAGAAAAIEPMSASRDPADWPARRRFQSAAPEWSSRI